MSNSTEECLKEFLKKTDKELMDQGLTLPQRLFHLGIKWADKQGILVNFGSAETRALFSEVKQEYKNLYPDGDFSGGPILRGGVGFRDQFYMVNIPIVYGHVRIELIDFIEISREAIESVWENYPQEFWRAVYVVSDLWDFSCGLSDAGLGRNDGPAGVLFNNAKDSIETSACSLLSPRATPSTILQNSFMAAELSIKGALSYCEMEDKDIRNKGHRLNELAETLCVLKPTSADDKVIEACSKLPPYVKSRYEHSELNRLQLIEICHIGQFVAADAVRRISNRNIMIENPFMHVPPRTAW